MLETPTVLVWQGVTMREPGSGHLSGFSTYALRKRGLDDPRDDALRLVARRWRSTICQPNCDSLGLPARE
jgi:hypothetical protein